MLSINYQKKTDASSGLLYITAEGSQGNSVATSNESYTGATASLDLQDPERLAEHTRHIFPAGASWGPERMDVNGRKGRRVMCVVAQDKKRYRIYDVDSNPDLEEPQDITDDGGDDVILEDES